MNYAFYDFETTGTSPAFDQPLQFAAILTDEDFNEIEVFNERARLSDHILPSPIAMAVTSVTPAMLMEGKYSAFEFSRALVNVIDKWSPAIWTGYNSIAFDENVFRQMLYQHLHPNIYATQLGGNLRLDFLKAVYACWAYGSDAITIPTQNGKLTSKLDQLAGANGFTNHNAHDALGDVRATIHVAKRIRDHAPEIWSHMLAATDKAALLKRLESGEIFELVERFGGAAPRIYTGVYCGTSHSNANEIGFFDLTNELDARYLDGNAEALARAVGKSPKIIRTVVVNKMPLLFPPQNVSDEFKETAATITKSEPMKFAVGEALADRYADRDEPELVEQKIYSDFYSGADKARLNKFQIGDWARRAQIVAEFDDPRLRELGERLIVLNAPEHASDATKKCFWQLIAARWSGEVFYGESDRDAGNTYQSVQDDLAQLEADGKFGVSPQELNDMKEFFAQRRIG